jgi:phosphoribosyl-dephospho-CoA transferase
MNIGELTSEIESGTFDSDLIKIKEAVDARLKASRTSRTLADFNIGDTVVFNDLTGTRYMVGQKATITGMKQKKVTVRLETPVGRFAHINPVTGRVESSNITVPVAIIDLVK